MQRVLQRFACALAFAALGAGPAAAFVCGETVESTIAVLGETDTYTFQAAAGDVMSLSLGGPDRFSSFGVIGQMRGPSNQLIRFRTIYDQTTANGACPSHTTCETFDPLPVTGTYTIRLFDLFGDATGTYSFTLEAVGGTWNGGSNAPPTPVCGAVADGARTIACGETVTGALDFDGDSDTYVFFADAGDVVGITAARPAVGTLNPVAELFAPDGSLVSIDGGNFCEHSTCESAPLPATGVYTIKFTDSGLTHTGPYHLTLESVAQSFDGTSNGPPTPACAAPPDGARTIACGQRLTGDMASTGDSDVFTFHADAGEGVAFWVEQPSGSALDPMADLFAPDGSFLARVTGPPFPAAPVASVSLPASGVYSLKVTDYNDGMVLDSTGPYALSLASGQLDGAVCRAGPLLRCGETVSGTLTATETDTFSFPARAGDAVRLHTAGPALAAPVLLAPNGAIVNAGSPLPQNGMYTVVLAANAGGAYQLTLEAVSGALNGGGNASPPLACGTGVSDGARAIECGQNLAGSLDLAGDSDVFTFFAEAGDVATLGIADGVAGFDPVAELFAPGGATLALAGEAVCGPSETCSSAALPATGAYTVRVFQPAGTTTGAYTLSMNRSPCGSDCQDGVDNDGDGLADFPNDAGCASPGDLSERRECEDGLDNDGDGLADFAGGDMGCASATAAVEDPACDDGRDNDGDGALDADGANAGAADAFCASPAAAKEAPSGAGACGAGPELALALPLLAALRRRTLSR